MDGATMRVSRRPVRARSAARKRERETTLPCSSEKGALAGETLVDDDVLASPGASLRWWPRWESFGGAREIQIWTDDLITGTNMEYFFA